MISRLSLLLVFLSMLGLPNAAFAQERSTVERKVLTPVDRPSLLRAEQDRHSRLERPSPIQFAVAQQVAFTTANSGVWEETDDGRVWRLSIFAEGALSMNLGLTDISLPEGTRLTISDPDEKLVQGPYTSEDISKKGRLFTALVEGDEIVVQLFVPREANDPALRISTVNKGFVPFGTNSLFKSGSCNNNVVCPEGAPWTSQIRSVARYTINGTGSCTGTLVNNTALDFVPYFLSANHCGVSAANDDTLVFYWNYESPNCGDLGGGSLADNQSGSTFRSSNTTSDFLLVELDTTPLAAWNVFYSGWDATGIAAPSTVGIHHPSGDEKAISFNTNPVISTNYGQTAVNAAANYWRVDDWEDGTTEQGSSGSCIWDAANGRCVGTLTGGSAACTAPAEDDWYGKLSSSWTGGGTNATRLSNWLDPGNTGVLTLNGDPHLRTLDGVRYDFQGAGEFVAVRDAEGTEVQVRQSPISTTFVPGANPYHGLKTCVSLNTAVAARIGKNRVTYQPRINREGQADPEQLVLRVDGKLVKLSGEPIRLPAGGMIIPVDNQGGILIEFPEKYALTVTPNYWDSQKTWYLNVSLVRRPVTTSGGISPQTEPVGIGGLNAPIATSNWLPLLPNGSSLGAMPADLDERFAILYEKFGESWRVTDNTSLFDYDPGQSTATFTNRIWPRPENDSSCPVDNVAPVREPTPEDVANKICGDVADDADREDCVFDAMVMGDRGLGLTYVRSSRLVARVIEASEAKRPPTRDDAFVVIPTAKPEKYPTHYK